MMKNFLFLCFFLLHYESNFKAYEKIPLTKQIILKPLSRHFFAIFSSKKTSKIGISHWEKTNEKDYFENEFIKILPGHAPFSSHENEFLEQILTRDTFWHFPCGKFYFKWFVLIFLKPRVRKKMLIFRFLCQIFRNF